jgi:hypothetical protein
MLRKIFRPKREEKKDWTKLRNEEHCSLYCSLNVGRVST